MRKCTIFTRKHIYAVKFKKTTVTRAHGEMEWESLLNYSLVGGRYWSVRRTEKDYGKGDGMRSEQIQKTED